MFVHEQRVRLANQKRDHDDNWADTVGPSYPQVQVGLLV